MKLLLFLAAIGLAGASHASKKSAPVPAHKYDATCDYCQLEHGHCEPWSCHPPRILVNGVCECPCGLVPDPEDDSNCIDPPPACCTDYIPDIFPPLTYQQACGSHGNCVENKNGTIECICKPCYYGPYCEFTLPQCENPVVTTQCPPTDCSRCPQPYCPEPLGCTQELPHCCDDFIPSFFPPKRYSDACLHGQCRSTGIEVSEIECVCEECWTGTFCDERVDSPYCSPNPITCNCPTLGPCTCPEPVTCPQRDCPPPAQPSCNDIVTYDFAGRPISYAEACIVDPQHPHGECINDNGNLYCQCLGCWDGLFCEHYNTQRCGSGGCPTVPPPSTPAPLRCSDMIPGLESGQTYNQACEVDFQHPHGVCVEHKDGYLSCECNLCWGGTFCEENTCPPPPSTCPEYTTPAPPPPIGCQSLVPNLFPPQTFQQACEVDPSNKHGECVDIPGTHTFECVCNKCWSGHFCELNTCPTPCPTTEAPPIINCDSPIPEWLTGKTYDQECGRAEGRGHCKNENGKLYCQCSKCWTGDFCEHNACIRRCAYNQLRPAFYHNPPSPYLYPQPVGGSDLPDELLACPPNFECVPDDKNCHYNRQVCINNVGWCVPTKREVASPAHPGDNVRVQNLKKSESGAQKSDIQNHPAAKKH